MDFNNQRFIATITLFLCLSTLYSQNYQVFTNPLRIDIPDIGPAAPYPSVINVSGLPTYAKDVKVHFESATHQSFDEIDMLLEAPNGQYVMLCSDAPAGGPTLGLINLWFGNSNEPAFTFEAISNVVEFRPTNNGLEADNFPAPGPGMIQQPSTSLHSLDGINPNGVWRLWVVGDEANGLGGYLGYNNILGNFGWQLVIDASSAPVCARPEPPELVMTEDTFALIRWATNGLVDNWDVFYSLDPTVKPNTSDPAPSIENSNQSANVRLSNLQPNREYSVWVRSDCGNTRSEWFGPLKFRSKIYPCKAPPVVHLCDGFDLTAVAPFTYWSPASCSNIPDITPKRIIQFTPPVSGTFEISGFQGSVAGHIAFKPVGGDCDTSGWTCLSQPPANGYNMNINLEANTAYLFFFDEISTQSLRFDACPFALDVPSDVRLRPIEISPVSAQFRWFQAGNNGLAVPGDWDILYRPVNAGLPNYFEPPTEQDIQTDDSGFFNLQQSLPQGGNYEIFIRRNCGDNWTCWANPLPFSTPVLSATASEVRLDSTWNNFGIDAFLSWKNNPDSAAANGWEISWGYVPFDSPEPQSSNVEVGTRVTVKIPDLSPSREYNFWIRPRFPSNVVPEPYWVQDWQGPFAFQMPDYCDLITEELFCMQNRTVGFSAAPQSEHLDLPVAACPPDGSRTSWEAVYKFRSPVTGPVKIVPLDALGDPGRQCLIYVKKASKGCWTANGWEHLGCWEMGSIPPVLTFEANKDTLYYLAFDTRQLGNEHIVEGFYFRVEGCAAPCPPVSGITCTYTDNTTATIKWNSIGPGTTYLVEFYGMDTFHIASHHDWADTTFTFTGLVPGKEYGAWALYNCNGNYIPTEAIRIRIGEEHPSLQNGNMTDCNPVFARVGGEPNRLYRYDIVDISVPSAGNYSLRAILDLGAAYLSIYKKPFDPNNPAVNLVTYTDSAALLETPTNLSAFLTPGVAYQGVISQLAPVYQELFTQPADHLITYELTGPDFPYLSKLKFNGRQVRGHGGLEAETLFNTWPDYTCLDTSGWLNMYRLGADPNQFDDDHIILSIQDYPERDIASYVGNGGRAIKINNPPADYAVNPSGWFVMDRYWDVIASLAGQPAYPILARFYFTERDFQALRDSVTMAGGIAPDVVEQLYFYKINDFFDNYNPDPTLGHLGIPLASSNRSDGYWEYKNGVEATDSTWRYEAYRDGHMAETLVRHFSGGGGGIGGNLKGAGVWVRSPVYQPELKIFPNPTNGWLQFDGLDNVSNAMVQIRDLNGRLKLSHTFETKHQLDISQLQPGMYFLTVSTAKWAKTWQVLKQ